MQLPTVSRECEFISSGEIKLLSSRLRVQIVSLTWANVKVVRLCTSSFGHGKALEVLNPTT